MSGGPACQCLQSALQPADRAWVVVQRNCNYSAFNGYHRRSSAYSSVECKTCRARWRTKAKYVNALRDREP